MKRILLESAAALALVAGSALGPGAAAQPRSLEVTGGALDPAVTTREAFVGTPAAAPAPDGCKVAEEYVRRINAGEFNRLAELYTEDAFIFSPLLGWKAVGRKQISDFYENKVSRAKPQIVPVAYGVGPDQCFQVFANKHQVSGQDRWVLNVVDHFGFDKDGKIKWMVAYARPNEAPVKLK